MSEDFEKATLRDLDAKGKRILVRVDYNVPIDKDGKVADDTRLVASLPTIRYLLEKGAAIILASHLGRPKGKQAPQYSLKPVATRLSRLLRLDVPLAPDCIGPAVEEQVAKLMPGQVLLLENLRFRPGEEANDPEFSDQLAKLADGYVNDAFGAAHRAHASVVGVPERIKPAVAGFLMQRELESLGRLLESPEHPFLAILGGAKVSGKVDVLESLLTKVDAVLIGGGMMFTFVKAAGGKIGKSLLEEDRIDLASRMMEQARASGVEFVVAPDCRAASSTSGGPIQVMPSNRVPDDLLGVDIGPESEQLFREKIMAARTIFWNGPMGIFETPDFAQGTDAVAQMLAEATKHGARTVIGGGDSAAALAKADLVEAVSHVSTGGGASLEFLEGKTLPGLSALDAKTGAKA
jgi:phosphoglycerate kinase